MADIEISVQNLVPEKLKVTERGVARAVNRAGSDAIKAMRVEASRKVREKKKIKAGALTDRSKFFTLIFPNNTGEAGDTGKSAERTWRLRVKNAYAPVISYQSPRQTKKGVTVGINTGARAVIRGAFIATMRSGHVGVFKRHGQATRGPTSRYKGHAKYAGQKRQPIRELFTSRVIDVFGDEDTVPGLQQKARAVFRATYVRNLIGSGRAK